MKWYLNTKTGKVIYIVQNVGEAVAHAQALRKRKVQETLNELHSIQLRCIDDAVEQSDMKEAQAVIAHIKNLPAIG
jgi:excinuclease UvrABC helicase subunit UvrB